MIPEMIIYCQFLDMVMKVGVVGRTRAGLVGKVLNSVDPLDLSALVFCGEIVPDPLERGFCLKPEFIRRKNIKLFAEETKQRAIERGCVYVPDRVPENGARFATLRDAPGVVFVSMSMDSTAGLNYQPLLERNWLLNQGFEAGFYNHRQQPFCVSYRHSGINGSVVLGAVKKNLFSQIGVPSIYTGEGLHVFNTGALDGSRFGEYILVYDSKTKMVESHRLPAS